MADWKSTFRADHIHLRSPNASEAGAFYKRMFDAEIQSVPRATGDPRYVVKLAGHTIFIDPMDATEKLEHITADPHFGLDHFGLTVDDLEAVFAELKMRGATFQRPYRRASPVLASCVVACPDSVRIEIVQR